MYINEDSCDSTYQITAYDDNSIQVGNARLSSTFIITPSELLEDWTTTPANQLSVSDADKIIALAPEVLLIGTGAATQHLPKDTRAQLESNGIGVECMTTKAACRSYIALSAEGRRIAALLYVK